MIRIKDIFEFNYLLIELKQQKISKQLPHTTFFFLPPSGKHVAKRRAAHAQDARQGRKGAFYRKALSIINTLVRYIDRETATEILYEIISFHMVFLHLICSNEIFPEYAAVMRIQRKHRNPTLIKILQAHKSI